MDGNTRKFFKAAFWLAVLACIFAYGLSGAKELIRDKEFADTYHKAQAGDVEEQVRLAQFYEQGEFTERNEKEALWWFARAAANGSKFAEDVLCKDYKIGCKDEKRN